MDNVKTAVSAALMMVFGFAANAEPQVLADFGGEPVEMILADILPKEDLPAKPAIDIEKELKQIINYPFSPALAKEGVLRSKDFAETQTHITRPLAFIGSGSKSRKWLMAYRKKLKSLGAMVFVVQASSQEQLVSVMQQYDGSIQPLPKSDTVFSQYQIEHFPVLITADGVYQ